MVRVDPAPTHDVPPTTDQWFREAARNHERERVYLAERTATRGQKREADHERRLHVAQAFLADRAQRADAHPAPSPKRCAVTGHDGRVLFDVATDEGLARDVPPEAHAFPGIRDSPEWLKDLGGGPLPSLAIHI